ncbi:hypothetical protein QZH41_014086, partial [Actinostola sp. cb2023]
PSKGVPPLTKQRCSLTYVGTKQRCSLTYLGTKQRCSLAYLGTKQRCSLTYFGTKQRCSLTYFGTKQRYFLTYLGTKQRTGVPSLTLGPSKGVPSLTLGPSKGVPLLILGPSKGVPSLTLGPSKGVPSLTLGPSKGVPSLTLGPSKGVPSLMLGPSKGVPSLTLGPTKVVPSLTLGPSKGVPSLTLGPSKGVPSLTLGPSKGVPLLLYQAKDRRFSANKRPSFKPSTYVKEHHFKVNTYKGLHWCDYCRNFLWGLTQQGFKCQDCGMNAHKQCTRVIASDCMPDKKYVRRVFGVDLTTLVKLHDTKRPFVVDVCIQEVEQRGLDSEGIYRISGFADDVEALKNSFDKEGDAANVGQYDDINTISGTLKLYLRQLPLPLITFETYNQFINAASTVLVSQNKSQNMMTEENLSIVFGPTMMRPPEGDSLSSLVDLKFQRLAVELLISHQDVLFDTQ